MNLIKYKFHNGKSVAALVCVGLFGDNRSLCFCALTSVGALFYFIKFIKREETNMKKKTFLKALALFLSAIMLLFVLASCGSEANEPADAKKKVSQNDLKNNSSNGSHTHKYFEKITKEATCTEKGIKTFTCSCGDSYTEEIPAKGRHTTEQGKCENCGQTINEHIDTVKAITESINSINSHVQNIRLKYYTFGHSYDNDYRNEFQSIIYESENIERILNNDSYIKKDSITEFDNLINMINSTTQTSNSTTSYSERLKILISFVEFYNKSGTGWLYTQYMPLAKKWY